MAVLRGTGEPSSIATFPERYSGIVASGLSGNGEVVDDGVLDVVVPGRDPMLPGLVPVPVPVPEPPVDGRV
jgi:hypothetical protein